MPARLLTALFLAASAVNLALMVPGGFVETRAFPAYPVAVIAGFNVFLTVLGLGSLALAWRVWRGAAGRALPLAAGLSFLAVYLADLGHVFPVSETAMPPLLFTLEALGVALSLPVIGGALALPAPASGDAPRSLPLPALVALVAAMGAIVVFATRAATG